MKDLRTIRIFLSILMLAATIAYLFIGEGVNPIAGVSQMVQIIPSAIMSTIGATAFWLMATFVFGRVYCSSVCPVGAFQDSATWMRRRFIKWQTRRMWRGAGKQKGGIALYKCRGPRIYPFRFARGGKYRFVVLVAYIVALIVMVSLATVIEPWNMFRSAARATNPEADASFLIFSGNIVYGAIFGCMSLMAVWVWALFKGRAFCNEVCPIGTVLGSISCNAMYQIEIDPDACVGCMKCEDVCKSRCVKVVSRYVDNGRCVRCFDCLKVCPEDAIRFTRNRNRRSTPLLQRRMDKSVQ